MQASPLDHDRRIDPISGSWPGELFFFRGDPEGTFAAPEMLEDERGEVMNLLGSWTVEGDGQCPLTGHGEIVEPEDRDVVILRDLRELDWNTVGERTGRSPDAARMLWARAMQRVGGLLEARMS